ncbi:MAG: NAD-dependent epimerase [Gammaproteobacteria bacterium]
MSILITGGAGFIGAALGERLLQDGEQIYAVDNLNDYYEVSLKRARLKRLLDYEEFEFAQIDISDRSSIETLFKEHHFDVVVNLAAQAGVRYSLENPAAYIDANLVGFGNILEGCRQSQVGHLVYASSSSVYGGNTQLPFSEDHSVDHPVSLYAATKKANEMMAHSYAHLYDLPCTGLRFFTVYGPWGRPDMAFFKFTRMMLAGEPIPVYNQGQLTRDFTYIDDIVEGVVRSIYMPAVASYQFDPSNPSPAISSAPFRLLNIGNGERVQLMDYIQTLEQCLEIDAKYDMLPMQDGDVMATHANVDRLRALTGYKPSTDIRTGLTLFCDWYREYYGIK